MKIKSFVKVCTGALVKLYLDGEHDSEFIGKISDIPIKYGKCHILNWWQSSDSSYIYINIEHLY